MLQPRSTRINPRASVVRPDEPQWRKVVARSKEFDLLVTAIACWLTGMQTWSNLMYMKSANQIWTHVLVSTVHYYRQLLPLLFAAALYNELPPNQRRQTPYGPRGAHPRI